MSSEAYTGNDLTHTGKRPELPLDIFEYWSLCGGQAQPFTPELVDKTNWYFNEIDRKYPGKKGEERQVENRYMTLQRTIEQTLVVLELTNLVPSSRSISEQVERFRPIQKELAETGNPLGVPPNITNLPLMDERTRESLERDWDNLELELYLRERVAAKVTEAAIVQSQYTDLTRIKRSTGHFIARKTPKERKYVPGRFITVPCLTQLRYVENKTILGKAPIRRIEATLRVIIAQQEDIDLAEPSDI